MRTTLKIALSLVSVLAASVLADQASGEGDLIGYLTRLEGDHAVLCARAPGNPDLSARITVLIRDLRSQAGLKEGGHESVAALNRFLFNHLGIRASQDLKDPCNLLPSRVLERKQGYCVGIAALYLALAEQLEIPIHAVATPSHVFLRYDDGSTRINIETFQQGANIPDEQFIREQRIPDASISRGVFMRNLTTGELLAQVHNNLGVVYSERKDYESAATEYRTAISLDPRMPAAYYNFGNDMLRTGKYRRAVGLFSKSLRLYPTDVWALNNRGLAWKGLGKMEKAEQDWKRVREIEPGFKVPG